MIEKLNKNLILVIIPLVIVAPFSCDLFLPSLPAMSQYFHVSGQTIQFTITIYLLGMAFSQLICGPLSDRFGRKPVLLGGLISYAIFSMVIVCLTSLKWVLLFRFLQAFGSCSTIVCALAMVRDFYPKEKIIKYVAIIFGTIGMCPALSPMIGGYLQTKFGWQANFVLMAFIGISLSLIAGFILKETHKTPNTSALAPKMMLGNYKNMLTHRRYLGFALGSGFAYGTIFTFFTVSASIFMGQFHVNASHFGLLVALNAIAIIVGSIVASQLSPRIGLSGVMLLGGALITMGGMVLLSLSYGYHLTLTGLVINTFTVTLGVGLIRPTGNAGAISLFPANVAGTAAALCNFMNFGAGALFGFVVGHLITTTVHPLAISFALLGLATMAAAFISRPKAKPLASRAETVV